MFGRNPNLGNPLMPVNPSDQPFLSPKRSFCHKGLSIPDISSGHSQVMSSSPQALQELLFLLSQRNQGTTVAQKLPHRGKCLQFSDQTIPVFALQKYKIRKAELPLQVPGSLIPAHAVAGEHKGILQSSRAQGLSACGKNLLAVLIFTVYKIPDADSLLCNSQQSNYFCCMNFSAVFLRIS